GESLFFEPGLFLGVLNDIIKEIKCLGRLAFLCGHGVYSQAGERTLAQREKHTTRGSQKRRRQLPIMHPWKIAGRRTLYSSSNNSPEVHDAKQEGQRIEDQGDGAHAKDSVRAKVPRKRG